MRSIAVTLLFLLLGAPSAAHADELKADYHRLARALQSRPAAAVSLRDAKPSTNAVLTRQDATARRDSVWDGALIGAGVGAASGYLWAFGQCGTNDSECFAIAGTVGIIGGAGIGAAVGAVVDALHK